MITKPIRCYLDLNHLINLAREHKQGNTSRLKRIMSLVADNKVIFPMSVGHLMEIASVGKDQQRQELADVIKKISQGHVLYPMFLLMRTDVRNRIIDHYSLNESIVDVYERAVVKGFFKAFGEYDIDYSGWDSSNPLASIIAKLQIDSVLEDEELIKLLLSLHIPKIGQGSQEHIQMMQAINQDRVMNRGKTLKEKEEECVLGLSREFVKLATDIIKDLGLTNEFLSKKPPSHFWTKEYMATIPIMNIWAKMHMYLYHDENREIKVNHFYDIFHIAVALPYCDVLALDKEMTHIITRHKMDQMYDSTVFNNLNKTIDFIEANA